MFHRPSAQSPSQLFFLPGLSRHSRADSGWLQNVLGIWRSNLLLVRMCFLATPVLWLTLPFGLGSLSLILGCFVRFWEPPPSHLSVFFSFSFHSILKLCSSSHNCLGHNYFFCRQALKLLVFITLDWMWSFLLIIAHSPFSEDEEQSSSQCFTLSMMVVSLEGLLQFWPLCFFTLDTG